jgi:hypothetical protein
MPHGCRLPGRLNQGQGSRSGQPGAAHPQSRSAPARSAPGRRRPRRRPRHRSAAAPRPAPPARPPRPSSSSSWPSSSRCASRAWPSRRPRPRSAPAPCALRARAAPGSTWTLLRLLQARCAVAVTGRSRAGAQARRAGSLQLFGHADLARHLHTIIADAALSPNSPPTLPLVKFTRPSSGWTRPTGPQTCQ